MPVPADSAWSCPARVVGRDAFLDYVLVGSLASWTQAIVLGLLVAG